MPEKDAIEETNEKQAKVQAPAAPPQAARSSSLPVLLSSLALLLAAFALAATLISNKNMGTRQPLNDIKGQLSAMESRVNHMEALMATDKHSLIQAELQKMLLNLHELSRLGDNETKAEISKAEAILLRLSTPATRVKAQVDLKSTEQAVPPDKPEAASATAPSAPESTGTSAPQDSQIMPAPEQSPSEPSIESGAASAKAVEKPLDETVNTPPPDTETDAMPASPPPMEK